MIVEASMIYINNKGQKIDHGNKFFENDQELKKFIKDRNHGWGRYEPIVINTYDASNIKALEQLFIQECHNHDLTYNYSDDHRVWEKGNSSANKLSRLATHLERHRAVEIYNSVVDQKLIEEHRKGFYWRV